MRRREALLGIVGVFGGLALLVLVVALLGLAFRPELTRFAREFVARFGLAGMLVGTALADGLHVPVPPQFYLLTGIASGYSHAVVFGVVLLGSELGGFLGFELARFVAARSAFFRARIAAPRRMLARIIRGPSAARGGLGLAAASLLPVGYSTLCMTGGAMGLPRRSYAVFGATRIVRLGLSYAVIAFAWGRG